MQYRRTLIFGSACTLLIVTCLQMVHVQVLSAQSVLLQDIPIEMPLPLDVAVGQTMIVGIPDTTLDRETEELLRRIRPGAIVLYERNIESLEQLATLIASIHALADAGGTPRPFIMIDEEPNGTTRLKLLSRVALAGASSRDLIDHAAQVLADAGVTVNLAPVADFSYTKDAYITDRMPFAREQDLTAFNTLFIQTMAQHGVATTLKHFPGAGMFADDPHTHKLVLPHDPDTLNRSLDIFAQGIAAGAQFVMTNHAVYEDLDAERPTTISPVVVSEMLRGRLNFHGIIITDDIEGMFAPTWGMDQTAVGIEALKAGHTMVMYAHELNAARDTYAAMLEVAESDPEFGCVVRDRARLLQEVKQLVHLQRKPHLQNASDGYVFGNGGGVEGSLVCSGAVLQGSVSRLYVDPVISACSTML